MAQYTTADIRNFVLIGHSSAGKTSLAEALLHTAGLTNRLGSVDDGTSIFDADEEEKQRKYSIDPGFGHFSWKNKTINLIDTPGFPDFSGGALPSLAAVETAVLVVSASTGIEMNSRKMFTAAGERNLARIIVINKIDADNLDLPALLSVITEQFGKQCRVLNLPSADGKSLVNCLEGADGQAAFGEPAQAHTDLLESIV
ncbi:MAG: GTP-binding protein, partial [Phycisphaerae bacterium]|nr:GTP-binding protein [Phycisphaerae bacterium]